MKHGVSLAVLGILLHMAGTAAQEWEAAGIDVRISWTTVTLTCPTDDDNTTPITWTKGKQQQPTKEAVYEITNYESSHNDEYTCTNGRFPGVLHLKVKVCENCIELDLWAVAGIVVADLLITLGILFLVYYWSKSRQASGGREPAGAGGRPRGQKMERPPPVPNPDYEPIRKGQREVYAGLEHRGY
uniref:T-cell surface glycoprotein CD3 epsilon chain n=1 Tax=Sphenodon punctatus TaxID=8508 RepID=A0A8D0GFI9_SPHPU